VVLAALVVHLSYLANIILRVSSGLPGRGTRIDALFRDTSLGIGPGCDFFQFYRAGEDLRAGRVFFQDYGAPTPPSRAPYAYNWVRYPPWLAYAIGLPATLLRPATAYLLWCAVIELAWATALVLLWRRCTSSAVRTVLLALFLIWSPHYVELFMGQTSTIMGTMLLLLTIAAVDGRRGVEAGWLTATMAFKYQTAWLAPVYLRLRRIGPYLIAVAVAVLLSAPYFIRHPDAWTVFNRWTFPQTNDQILYQGNFGLAALFAHITGNYSLGLYRILSVTLIVAAAVRSLATRTVDPLRGITLWILTMFFTQIAAYEHHYNLLLPILALGFLQVRSWLYLAALFLLAVPTPYYWFSSVMTGYTPLDPRACAVTAAFKVVPLIAIYAELLWRGVGYRAVNLQNPALGHGCPDA
jgi:hypothetical protein